MFVRSTRLNLALSVLFVATMGACGNLGGCGACSATQPLPGGKLPADQTVEGGAQVRVTPQGFNKLTAILPSLINQQFGSGFCVPKGSALGFVTYCGNNQGQCTPGCRIVPTINPGGLQVSVTNQNTLHLRVDAAGSTSVPISAGILGSCTLSISVDHLIADVDIVLGTDPATGELTIHANQINQFSFNGQHFNGCGIISDLASLVVDILNSAVGQFVIQLLTPVIDNLVQGFLPHPLGIAGMMDVGKLLEGISPGTTAEMEARIVPGGYVHMSNNGLSLGVITGLNSDEDPSTRTPGLSSEPALCVPPLPAPNFGAPPANLPITSRSTYLLDVAPEFNGVPDPATDLAMGVSETTLDLAGHHAVTSGAMCLGIGTSFIKQLNVGTIGLLVPSLGDLGDGKDPLLLVTRPQRALDFTIGENTTASPALTIAIDHLEVDFYAFLYERYVRAFTLDLSMNVGVNLDFQQLPGMPAQIKPTLVGISSHNVTVKVLNSEFVKETPEHLEMVLPSVFDLVTGNLDIPAFNVPSFAGFSLNNLRIQHVKTTQDDFLALYASLGSSMMMRQIGQADPLMAHAVTMIDADAAPPQPPAQGRVQLAKVATPDPEHVRAALLKQTDGALPEVTFDVDTRDALGRELEWSYQLNSGMFHPWQSGSPLVISDRAFAWQGKFTVGLRSRVKGDYRTVSETIETPVVIDSVAPRMFVDKGEWKNDVYTLPAYDLVSGTKLQYAFGRPGSKAPESEWFAGGNIELARDAAEAYSDEHGQVAVFAKDEVGNTSIALIAPFHGSGNGQGCSCDAHGAPTTGGLVLVGLVGGLVFRRRRPLARLLRRRSVAVGATWLGMSLVMSLAPGCSCGKSSGQHCEMDSDCPKDSCPQGQLPFCVDNTCVCSDDIPLGKVGPYSDVAVGSDGSIWVSAYAQDHGDLVVAHAMGGRIPDESWEWVDGVPDGPVVIPGSKIRGGIEADGPDVGMYTSIAVGPDGSVLVSYFDRETASLKFAQRAADGTWTSHIIDQGTGQLGEGGVLAGMYTSLTLRKDDGRPGIAYLAHVMDGAGGHAEVRYVSAQTPHPASAADWQMWVVDTAPLPPDDPNNPNIYPLPEGLGLFIDSARLPNQAPVVVYYDRGAGELKLTKFDAGTGQFGVPKVLDGSAGKDEGWSPSIAVDQSGVCHVVYVGATEDDLKYITDAANAKAEIIDDGYRIVGQTVDGLPKPEFHFVGDDAGIVIPAGGTPLVVYQDATTQELLLANKESGSWAHSSIAGATQPWPGGYGFFAASAISGGSIIMSTWVINQPAEEFYNTNWVEVFSRPITIQ